MTGPLSRRAALAGALSAAPALVGAPAAATPSVTSPVNPDAEIIALSAEICRRADKARAIHDAGWLPFEEEYYAIMDCGHVGEYSHMWRTSESVNKALA